MSFRMPAGEGDFDQFAAGAEVLATGFEDGVVDDGRQLISSSRGGSPGPVSGARWMHGGTALPGHSTAIRHR